MEKYNGKYRIKSARCPVWDYCSRGAYFITICTKNRIQFFGDISNHKMILSAAGEIVQKNWKSILNHFPYVGLDAFVVMPNHFHGIIIIKQKPSKTFEPNDTKRPEGLDADPVEEIFKRENDFFSKISPNEGSISTIIRSFKSSCTREINLKIPELHFAWQSRFYDIIIRDQKSHERIRQYIHNNPLNWKEDMFNKEPI
jgi:putative transposase